MFLPMDTLEHVISSGIYSVYLDMTSIYNQCIDAQI